MTYLFRLSSLLFLCTHKGERNIGKINRQSIPKTPSCTDSNSAKLLLTHSQMFISLAIHHTTTLTIMTFPVSVPLLSSGFSSKLMTANLNAGTFLIYSEMSVKDF